VATNQPMIIDVEGLAVAVRVKSRWVFDLESTPNLVVASPVLAAAHMKSWLGHAVGMRHVIGHCVPDEIGRIDSVPPSDASERAAALKPLAGLGTTFD